MIPQTLSDERDVAFHVTVHEDRELHAGAHRAELLWDWDVREVELEGRMLTPAQFEANVGRREAARMYEVVANDIA